ncbi:MAG: DUF1501 domain-containing protein [Pirellulaceae bacterium]
MIENIDLQVSKQARRQLDLLAQWNTAHRQGRLDDRLDARIQSYELAFRMQQEAEEAFDLSRESQTTLDMYGAAVHGRQTLIARRLLERGVRYIQLWHGAGQPWDNHDKIEQNHRTLAAQIDQPIAALLTDLKQRGMLEETLVLWGGEFQELRQSNSAAAEKPCWAATTITTDLPCVDGWWRNQRWDRIWGHRRIWF